MLDIGDLSKAIQLALAPAFLLTGGGADGANDEVRLNADPSLTTLASLSHILRAD